MSNLIPSSSFDDIYKLTSSDLVDASNPDPMHPNGVANRQAQQLLNRTHWIFNNAPVNQSSAITVTNWPPTNISNITAPGHYTLNSSTSAFRGGLIVFVNGLANHSRIQVVYRKNPSSNKVQVAMRCYLTSSWGDWFTLCDDNHNLNHHSDVDTGSLGAGDNGKVLTWDGVKWVANELSTTVHWDNIDGKPSSFNPSSHNLNNHSNVSFTNNPSVGQFLGWNGSTWRALNLDSYIDFPEGSGNATLAFAWDQYVTHRLWVAPGWTATVSGTSYSGSYNGIVSIGTVGTLSTSGIKNILCQYARGGRHESSKARILRSSSAPLWIDDWGNLMWAIATD